MISSIVIVVIIKEVDGGHAKIITTTDTPACGDEASGRPPPAPRVDVKARAQGVVPSVMESSRETSPHLSTCPPRSSSVFLVIRASHSSRSAVT
jgi:hypothetical protein